MKRIIIVSPHFPPSNLAAVHRSRLFAQHLPSSNWEPIIITVHESNYEEELDWNLVKLLPDNLRIEKVDALPSKPLRLVGDIGIRGFYQMYKRIIKIIKEEGADFLYIPIPSHFAALLGRLVHDKTGIKYGIDYIDPWVHKWPGTEKKFSKHWWSMKLGEWLEPIALKKASLITGVAPGYFKDVLLRNPALSTQAITESMPYGGEEQDHLFVSREGIKPYLFQKQVGVIDLVYAGAMLPKALEPLKRVLNAISKNITSFQNTRFHFIGTGTSPNDPEGYNIKQFAVEYGLYGSIIFEYPKRIPYLDVLAHLEAADGAFILGSTEAHYTPSKVYQSVLSGKPVYAVLHNASTAAEIIENTKAGVTLSFNGESDLDRIEIDFLNKWIQYKQFLYSFDPLKVDLDEFNKYSAQNVTKALVQALNKIIT